MLSSMIIGNLLTQKQLKNVVEIDTKAKFYPTFYTKLLHIQILKAQKRQSCRQYLLSLWGFTHVKATSKMLMKLKPVRNCLCFLKLYSAAFLTRATHTYTEPGDH